MPSGPSPALIGYCRDFETGKRLTKIFITHSHPDHYFGLGHIAEAFPEAQVLALPEDCQIINEQFLARWSTGTGYRQ